MEDNDKRMDELRKIHEESEALDYLFRESLEECEASDSFYKKEMEQYSAWLESETTGNMRIRELLNDNINHIEKMKRDNIDKMNELQEQYSYKKRKYDEMRREIENNEER